MFLSHSDLWVQGGEIVNKKSHMIAYALSEEFGVGWVKFR